jgi:hypothetical protein
VFSITVPKDFGNQRFTWTIVANGQTSAVTFWLNPPYLVEPFKNLANGNTPPIIRFSGSGDLQGPPRAIAQTLRAKIGELQPMCRHHRRQPPRAGVGVAVRRRS